MENTKQFLIFFCLKMIAFLQVGGLLQIQVDTSLHESHT